MGPIHVTSSILQLATLSRFSFFCLLDYSANAETLQHVASLTRLFALWRPEVEVVIDKEVYTPPVESDHEVGARRYAVQ